MLVSLPAPAVPSAAAAPAPRPPTLSGAAVAEGGRTGTHGPWLVIGARASGGREGESRDSCDSRRATGVNAMVQVSMRSG